MGIAGTFYRIVGRRFSTSLAFAAGGVFFLDLVVNRGGDYIWDTNNAGKQWKEIKPLIQRLQKENAELAAKAKEEEEAEEQAGEQSSDNETAESKGEPKDEETTDGSSESS